MYLEILHYSKTKFSTKFQIPKIPKIQKVPKTFKRTNTRINRQNRFKMFHGPRMKLSGELTIPKNREKIGKTFRHPGNHWSDINGGGREEETAEKANRRVFVTVWSDRRARIGLKLIDAKRETGRGTGRRKSRESSRHNCRR